MDDTTQDTPLTLVADGGGASGGAASAAPDYLWTLFPPKAVRRRCFARVRSLRRPVGTLAVPAIAGTGAAYFTGVLSHADTPVALGLAALAVFHDAVTAVCRTWQHTRGGAAAPAVTEPAGEGVAYRRGAGARENHAG